MKQQDQNQTTVPGTAIAMLPELTPFLVPVDDVHPDPANPRILKDLGVLKASLQRFGLRRPIIANRRDKQIEAGHQTRQALLELGATHVPVMWADDDRIQATAFNIADNRTSEVVSDWDEAALAKLLKDLTVEGAVDGIGFDEKQMSALIDSFADEQALDADALPEIDLGEPDDLCGRVIIIYEGEEEFRKVQDLLGVKLGNKISWSIGELSDGD
jgi:ParB-like chromosome segregation protein Spo0J